MSTSHLIPKTLAVILFPQQVLRSPLVIPRIESISDRLVLWKHGGGGNPCWKTTQLLSRPSHRQLKAANHSWQRNRWGGNLPEKQILMDERGEKRRCILKYLVWFCRQKCVFLCFFTGMYRKQTCRTYYNTWGGVKNRQVLSVRRGVIRFLYLVVDFTEVRRAKKQHLLDQQQ